jgi:uridine kinase
MQPLEHAGPHRADVLRAVWDVVPRPDRPALVAVDGPDGAGKTRFAADLVTHTDRPVVVAALDDFHHLRAWRHAEGRTGATVWARSFDYAALRRELVDPWRSGAGTPFRRRWHDLASDTYPDEPQIPVPRSGVLVVEGVFAQRSELADAWDLVVYVDAREEVRVSRMAARDGVPADARHPAQRRYLDAQRIYLDACGPLEAADVVVDNSDPGRPRIVRIRAGLAPVAHNGQS